MIKLIATDMDGTLLTTDKRMPKDILPVVRALKEKGIAFAVASGRQYAALRRDLHELVDDVIFIAENGALIMENDRQLHIEALPAHLVPDILAAVKGLSGVYAVVCCADGALVDASADPDFVREMAMYYNNAQVVPDLAAFCSGMKNICKIAFCDKGRAAAHVLPVLERELGGGLSVILSGEDWVDIMKPGVHKGSAMAMLQTQRGLAKEDCMAFGDYLNDYELLMSVGESYAMKNALPELKQIAKHIAPGNDEDGVMRVIKERFKIKL